MFQHTLDRAAHLTPWERVVVVAVRHHQPEGLASARWEAGGHRIVAARESGHGGRAVSPANLYILARDPGASVVVYPSDHFIYPEDRFVRAVEQAARGSELLGGRPVLLAAGPDSLLIRQGTGDPDRSSSFIRAAEASFGSYGVWKTDFVATASMRGVGWTICYYDPMTGRLSNHWISSHEVGTIAGFVPLVVLDLWEHAFLLDYAPSERQAYVETFFSNIHWEAVDERLNE